jgi:site-specific recombinase XerD
MEKLALFFMETDTAWSGRRDRVLFTVMYNTGARVSEAIGICRGDLRAASDKGEKTAQG